MALMLRRNEPRREEFLEMKGRVGQIISRDESRRDCPKLAGGVSPRYRAKGGKAPAGAEAADGNSGVWRAGEHAEAVKPIYERLN